MGLLTHAERYTLASQLLKLPNIRNRSICEQLLSRQPSAIRAGIQFTGATVADINAIINAADADSARQADGSWPILWLIEDALASTHDTTLASDLQQLLDDVHLAR